MKFLVDLGARKKFMEDKTKILFKQPDSELLVRIAFKNYLAILKIE